MAINVDRVYQKVLAITNKEQRGYITPQEFNLFATRAQMEIFEQYFYDVNQWSRQPGNSHAYSDILEVLEQKISHFKIYDASFAVPNSTGYIDYDNEVVYRLGEVKVKYPSVLGNNYKMIAERIKVEDHQLYLDSPLAKQNYKRPIYWQASTGGPSVRIRIYPKPTPSDDVLLTYIRRPRDPKWTYIVTSDTQVALYDATGVGAQNFELEVSEESELVNRILAYAGITIQKPEITQVAAGLENNKIQQEKQ